MEACRVRYGNTTSDAQMKQISSRMAEASIKFDLLSVDPKCLVQVKCFLDDTVDLRSSGSFVLYNYARIATIMDKFEAGVKGGDPFTTWLNATQGVYRRNLFTTAPSVYY